MGEVHVCMFIYTCMSYSTVLYSVATSVSGEVLLSQSLAVCLAPTSIECNDVLCNTHTMYLYINVQYYYDGVCMVALFLFACVL